MAVLFFADECVAGQIIDGLRQHGHDVTCAYEVCRGEPDSNVRSLAAAAGRILITDDQGFGELAIRLSQPAAGVVILSLSQLPAGVREQYAVERIEEVANQIAAHLVIIEPGRTRLRPLPRREQN